jgi:hypothetical protein
MTSILFSRSRRTASIRSGRAGGLAGKLAACLPLSAPEARMSLYADAAALLVVIYERNWFPIFGSRAIVEALRQIPIILLSKYSSATMSECGQVLSFIMLGLPTILCALCWFVLPRNSKAWILFPHRQSHERRHARHYSWRCRANPQVPTSGPGQTRGLSHQHLC